VTDEPAGFVWLASYPKSGSTWFRTVLWALDHPDDDEVDLDNLPAMPMASHRYSLDEATGVDSAGLPPDEVDVLRPAATRRLLAEPDVDKVVAGVWVRKAHDAYTRTRSGEPLFPPDATRSAVYIVRNPLDVSVSYAHHQGSDLDSVIDQMADPDDAMAGRSDRAAAQLRQRLGGWSGHVRSWLDQTDVRVVALRYEDLHGPDLDAVAAAAAYCGRTADPTAVQHALDRCAFARLASHEARHGFGERPPTVDRFFRKGRAGGWRGHLSDGQVARLVGDHAAVMSRLGYLDATGTPC
jgi:aryl sulfotransferase